MRKRTKNLVKNIEIQIELETTLLKLTLNTNWSPVNLFGERDDFELSSGCTFETSGQ